MTRQRPTVVLNRTQKAKGLKKKETTAVGKLLRALGATGGSALGSMVGQSALGGAAGHQLAGMASKWLGFGDYKISRNSLMTKASSGIPAMHSTNQSVVVRHKEYIGQIRGHTTFKVRQELPLNPGIGSTFPWLCDIAAKYQEYVIRGAVFHYVPTSGMAINSTDPALGTVMLQTSYRASDTAPTSKNEMMNEYWATESMPCETFIHPIECDPRENPFSVHYVRTRDVPAGEPLMSYDLGKTFVAVSGQAADDKVIGDLWITYEVELKKPVVSSPVVACNYSQYQFNTPSGGLWANLFNNVSYYRGTQLGAHLGNTFEIPAGYGTAVAVTLFLPSTFSVFNGATPTVDNGTLIPLNAEQNTSCFRTTVNSGSAQVIYYFEVAITDSSFGTLITMTTPVAITGSVGSFDLHVMAIEHRNQ